MIFLACSSDFSYFIINNLSESDSEKIKQILLFPDKEEATLFIDLKEQDSNLSQRLRTSFSQFISKPEYELSGLKSKLHLVVDTLENTEFNEKLINATIIYAAPSSSVEKVKILISWENVKPNTKRVLLNKRLFGYTHSGKKYFGLVKKLDAEKFGKGCILISKEHEKEFFDLFDSMSIKIKKKEMIG